MEERRILDDLMRLLQRAGKSNHCIGPEDALEGRLLREWHEIRRRYTKLVSTRPN